MGATQSVAPQGAPESDVLPTLARVRRVVLEEMSVADQMATVAGASALLGVHGQAFAWLPFLPWPTRPVGIIEISIASRRGAINACYER